MQKPSNEWSSGITRTEQIFNQQKKIYQDATKAAAVIGIAGLYEACKPKKQVTQPQIVIVGGGHSRSARCDLLKNAG